MLELLHKLGFNPILLQPGGKKPLGCWKEQQDKRPTLSELEKAKTNHFTYQFDVVSATPYLRIALGVYDEVSKEYALNLVDLQPPAKKR